ncbi:MAG: Holliday junction branch migration protein RuvA [Clostridia bacterium]|nr:Holliday junction branch migration protein RuvA [Clostridia bacterium]
MFYFIRGELVLIDQNFAVIDAAGVGYKLTVSGHTHAALPRSPEKQKNVTLYTYLSVREDGVELFGFATLEELNIYKLLISVSGIGPKAALSLLSFLSPEKIALAVCSEDKKLIAKAPGIGPKTAARIILELKDKLHADASADGGEDIAVAPSAASGNHSAEALDALMVLGFNRSAALEALKGIDPSEELEDIIREALKKLMR